MFENLKRELMSEHGLTVADAIIMESIEEFENDDIIMASIIDAGEEEDGLYDEKCNEEVTTDSPIGTGYIDGQDAAFNNVNDGNEVLPTVKNIEMDADYAEIKSLCESITIESDDEDAGANEYLDNIATNIADDKEIRELVSKIPVDEKEDDSIYGGDPEVKDGASNVEEPTLEDLAGTLEDDGEDLFL